MTDLSGRTAIVTGAASGIGRATVDVLVACGARVGLLDIDARVGCRSLCRSGRHCAGRRGNLRRASDQDGARSDRRAGQQCRHRQQHRAARKDGASPLLVAELISAVAIYLLMLDQLKVFIFRRFNVRFRLRTIGTKSRGAVYSPFSVHRLPVEVRQSARSSR